MNENQFTLSIITVVYNGGKYIRPTIESVIHQTFTDYEYLIIDGKSTDQTLNIIEEYHHQISTIISETDKGVYDAMNKGLSKARGKYVLFLNAGDELASPMVLKNLFNLSSDADLFYGETIILNEKREPIGTRTELTSRKLPDKLNKKDFLNGQVVSHQSFIPKRSLCNPYNLKYTCSADVDWQLSVISGTSKRVKSKEPITKYLQGGISDRQLATCWKERFLILLKYFNPVLVLIKHFEFAFRFLKFGAYRKH